MRVAFAMEMIMTSMTRDALARLLARAHYALAGTGAANQVLADELNQAAMRIGTNPVPWTVDVHVGFVDHREGGNLYAAFTREALVAEIAGFSREWWSEIRDDRNPATLGDEEICSIYFEQHSDEYLWTERMTIEGPGPASSPPLRIGRHLVISTSHIAPSTADLLDQWAPLLPEARPLGVSETGYGWFVLTDPLDAEEMDMVPHELREAIDFARREGCRWLHLDRDAAWIDGLETFEW
ncbi:hypothetical protein [Sphingobium sp.]|uniref:DUF5983 family protein n=2 Tax=Sphingobium TaxID=165695 RepID=UPI003BAEA02C